MNQELIQEIQNFIRNGSCKVDEPMKNHTTFRIGGRADLFVEPTAEELPKLLSFAREHSLPVTLIGNGSNILVSDKGIRGLTISLSRPMSRISVEGDRIYAEAGALLGRVASLALDAGLSGMEALSGIPGTIGGACLMNAGAYGSEMADILESCDVITPDGELITFPVEDLGLSYRHSFLMETGDIIVGAHLLLQPGDKDEIRARQQDYNQRRSDKQPLNYPSAGSTFKRPTGFFAGQLIEECGLKGYREGGAMVSDKHSGFVVNAGDATAMDVIRLMNHVEDTVLSMKGVRLEPEVRFLGEL